jgi:hypothetical protein
MCQLIEWPGYDPAFRLHKVINEPDFLPLHIVRLLAEAAQLVRTARQVSGDALGKVDVSEARQGNLGDLFHLAFWHMDLGYFGRACSALGRRRTSALCCGRYRFPQAAGKPVRN